MSDNLLVAISIGPVQDFIAAARKTRDLWFGSYVLSEVSKAAAHALTEFTDVELIFPVLEKPGQGEAEPSKLRVANKILASVPAKLDIRAVIERCREAAVQRWLAFAEETYQKLERFIDSELWEQQIHDVIEFYAAWVPLQADYAASRTKVERLLAGRKALRDFRTATGRKGVPKSSLDGARESVIVRAHRIWSDVRRAARLKENEQLDAIGLVKRVAGGEKHFPSVTRVAVDPWIRRLLNDTRQTNGKVYIEGVKDLLQRHEIREQMEYTPYSVFPYDGSFFYPFRLPGYLKEEGIDLSIQEKIHKIYKNGNIYKLYGEPTPYFAVLVADGDRMGAAMSAIRTVEGHRNFSRQLSKFAKEAETIVKEHYGALVYSGGDDVMAFLPLDQCLQAARRLKDNFGKVMGSFQTAEGDQPTLSIGLAIGHCFEPMEYLLHMGRSAEKLAKSPDRNGLAVTFQTRSGGELVQFRESWGKNPDEEIMQWIDMFAEGKLSSKAAYDLKRLAQDYRGWNLSGTEDELLKKDCIRLFKKKSPRQGRLDEKLLEELLGGIKTVKDVERLMNKLILALQIARCFRLKHPEDLEVR